MSESVVLYEERGSVAIVTLNRPEKMNTLTEGVIQGVADGIDRANASKPVRFTRPTVAFFSSMKSISYAWKSSRPYSLQCKRMHSPSQVALNAHLVP